MEDLTGFKVKIEGFQNIKGERFQVKHRTFYILARDKYHAEDEIMRVLKENNYERVKVLNIQPETK